MKLPFGIEIKFNSNGKYVHQDVCDSKHEDFKEHLDRKLTEITIDRNQKLAELKFDLTELINLRIESVNFKIDLLNK